MINLVKVMGVIAMATFSWKIYQGETVIDAFMTGAILFIAILFLLFLGNQIIGGSINLLNQGNENNEAMLDDFSDGSEIEETE